ncbi:MAG TPA: DNA polymerase [Scandinavium sp.]|jgi:DNA polymerase-1|uniref:DNA polymerase n=1 Tax=Scandinavium sp. TaxID=2830653 RepID=UPI002E30DB69|nr:DNA polymerase [Scandinavium sp.]HEX4500591.1 DNA polymerase [Scandinavium sp.]
MKIIYTDKLERPPSSETEKLWIYNGLDTMVTQEVFRAIETDLNETTRATYEFSKALQGPTMEMKLRGVRIDVQVRDQLVRDFESEIGEIEYHLQRILIGGVGVSAINWRSPAQVSNLLYNVLDCPPVRRAGKTTVNRDALEKLKSYFLAEPLINHILACRDLHKKIGVLKTEIDSDNRIRTSYNIAGTNTGRFSSSFSDFGTGTNLQNIEKRLRRIFVADSGMKFAQLDAEQGDSRCVGAIEWNLFRDGAYLDACESGDLHTSVSRMAWPNMQWTGDIRADREIAEQPFYRQHSFRHMAKVLGHGTNYMGTPSTMAVHTKIDSGVIEKFQSAYFRGFPGHLSWHISVANVLKRDGFLVSLMGRRRHFLGRLTEAETIREAVAYDPQGSCSDILNNGMLQVWQANICQVLMNIHDAILVQYPQEREDEIVHQLKSLMRHPVVLQHDRVMELPYEVKTGWNWADHSKDNPDGLKKYNGCDSRCRSEEIK